MTVGFAGVTAMETNVTGADVTVKVTAVEATLPKWATMDVVPAATAVARPAEPAALMIVAVTVLEELHVTESVITFVDSSL
jgi:hypothetical protein